MKIVADENMPDLGLFAAYGEVVALPGRQITTQDVADADVLLIRSITEVNAGLLAESAVRFVGSATIGTNHIDRNYLDQQGIAFAHAPGCNARAVAEYVLQALLGLDQIRATGALGCTAAVVGYGNVGKQVAALFHALGMHVVVCDPPLETQKESCPFPYVDLDQALQSDVITLHVPLSHTGDWPTYHLLNGERLRRLNDTQCLINTCRGEVIDNAALLAHLQLPSRPSVVLDVWEGEPSVSAELFRCVQLGTPHIAGYSVQGKQAGTHMVFSQFCRWLGQDPEARVEGNTSNREIRTLVRPIQCEQDILSLLRGAYDLRVDHEALAASLSADNPRNAFDALRKNYPLRSELHTFCHQGDVAQRWQGLITQLVVGA